MDIEIALALTIIALPLISFAITIFFGKRLPMKGASLPVAAMGIDLAMAIFILTRVIGGYHHTEHLNWFDIGRLNVTFSVTVDPLAAVMLCVVTLVSFLVHVYSTGYMHGDPRYSRYFAFLSLFSFSMLGLVLAASFFIIFIFWELVGLSSYLLIGFWYEKKSAADAGKKAFITTRTGDLGFMVGVFIIYSATGSFAFHDAFEAVRSGTLAGPLLTAAAICVFCGAVGKSAQFPLHVWLPDAMEGPTPVSALIHAATMVAAGVYLVARCSTIFIASESGALTVAVIGGWTAFFAATIACTQYDIKRVLAYSTLSQLGFMMLALGVGGYVAGMFHLTTHACFKALLFLGSGSVIHAVHTQDIREMGGLRKTMPVTTLTFLIGSLALAGIPPLSGFWSKDEILLHVKHDGPLILYILASAAAFMTAFYMARLCYLTFFGKPRRKGEAHESPRSMTAPLVVLAFFSVTIGWINIPHLFEGFGHFVHFEGAHHLKFSPTVAVVSTLIAVAGLLLGTAMYYWKSIPVDFLSKRFPPIYRLLYNKWYIDEIYGALIIRPLLALTRGLFKFDLTVIDGAVNGTAWVTIVLSKIKRWFDIYIVDGAVNGVGWVTQTSGKGMRRMQTGHVQEYALAILLGAVTMAILALFV
jgi:NADH-quinone oxidoreductase subunit L